MLDQLLIARGGKVDLFVATKPITRVDDGNWFSIQGAADPNPWVADQEVVHLVAELDELLFGFGLLDGVHTPIVTSFLVLEPLLLLRAGVLLLHPHQTAVQLQCTHAHPGRR